MRIIATFILLIFAAAAMNSCGEKKETTEESTNVVEFKGRKIDLEPYFKGFPYSGFNPIYKADKLFYYKTGDETILYVTDLKKNPDLEKGTKVSDIDFSKRNAWGIKYRPDDNSLYWNGDEKNDEVMNLYRMSLETGEPEKITDVPYVFGWSRNEEKDKIAYVARLGTKGERLGELRLKNVSDLGEEAIVQDVPELRFTWHSPSWRPNEKGLVCVALKDAHRNWGNLVYVDLENKTWRVLTDSSIERKGIAPLDKWLSDDEFFFVSNEDGFYNIYKFNVETGDVKQLTNFEIDVDGVELIEIDGDKYLFAVTSNPIENEIYLIDPNSGEIVNRKKIDLNIGIADTKDNKVMISGTSASSMFQMDEITCSKDGFAFERVVDVPQELKDKIMHAKVEKVEIPTFDVDPNTGETRMLHAFLYVPENPLPKDEALAVVHAFYGGGNYFHPRSQILAEAGIYILSSAPRGSSGFGKEFSSLNDKDLGGNEIIDIIYSGKYISEKLDIPPSRVGLFGGSHGGYAVMRLMTFPGEINGLEADFDWGFGMSHAGFSDIIHFYEHCNIPDWVILEAGDPETEADKLRDRSPLYHADKLKGRLLLTHGENDNRVPVEGSVFMADSIKARGKGDQVELMIFEGQGHPVKGLENNLKFYKAWFDFMSKAK